MPSSVRLVNLFSRSGLNLSAGADTPCADLVLSCPGTAATARRKEKDRDTDMPRAMKLFAILALWTLGSVWPSCALALNQILNVRHWVAPDHTRVVIDMTEDVSFTVEKG